MYLTILVETSLFYHYYGLDFLFDVQRAEQNFKEVMHLHYVNQSHPRPDSLIQGPTKFHNFSQGLLTHYGYAHSLSARIDVPEFRRFFKERINFLGFGPIPQPSGKQRQQNL